jgi:hypothetical protein
MARRLAFGRLSGRLLMALWLPATTTWANECQEASPTAPVTESAAAPGRQFLSQGVALFDAKNFKMAERALQSALFAGLPNPHERVLAHKYLAFVFCSNGEASRCEAEFDAAFLARPSFSLDAYEIQNTPWRDAYLKSQTRWAAHCGKQLGPIQSGPNAGTFALNSTVIVAISPLMPAAMGFGSSSAKSKVPYLLPSSNVSLRVSPWARIDVDGKRFGVTPPMTHFNLPQGTRTIELSNPGFETVKRVVRVVDGQTVTITHDFDAR